jgi:acyl-coenzyme A thioesterase PaaI-like protein
VAELTFPIAGLTADPDPLPASIGQCLICGQANPLGVRLRFHRLIGGDGAVVGVRAETAVPEHLQGFDGLLHGGIICALLDDAMWWAVHAKYGVITVTADMQLRFRRPIPITTLLRLEGVAGDARRIYAAAGRILDASGTTLAEASGRFVPSPALTIRFGSEAG